MRSTSIKTHRFYAFIIGLGCIIAGALIILLFDRFQVTPAPHKGEYYYSELFRYNFTLPVRIVFALTAGIICFLLKENPWLVGCCLVGIFVIITFIEGTVYRGSHNLLPFELGVFAVWALPNVAAGYIGKILAAKFKRTN